MGVLGRLPGADRVAVLLLVLVIGIAGCARSPVTLAPEFGPDSWQHFNRQSQAYLEQGDYGNALQAANQALERVKVQQGEQHPDVAATLANIAHLYALLYNHRFSESHYLKALRIRRQAFGADHPLVGEDRLGLGKAYYHQQKLPEAENALKGALAIVVNKFGWDDQRALPYLAPLARLYEDRHQFALAVPLRDRAVVLTEQQHGSGHAEVAVAQARLAFATTNNGDAARAAGLYEASMPALERHYGAGSPQLASMLDQLAVAYSLQQRYRSAEPVLSRALAIRKNSYGMGHLETAVSYDRLADLYREMGRTQAAYEHRQKAHEIRETIRTDR